MEKKTPKKVVKKAMAKPEQKPAVADKISFTYNITNDGHVIKKDFNGEASPQDVILTLFSCMIGDIKSNIHPSEYENILGFLVTQYRATLLPNVIADVK
jgi:hypothetical protein